MGLNVRRQVIPVPLIALLLVLAGLEYAIYFWRADHFFQGDTLFWFYYRLRSFGEFLGSFASPDPGGWYRPLTNRTVQSLLYPLLGLNPAGYRVATYALFAADTVAVLGLSLKLTRKPVAAAIATTFFAVHTINAYTTYDLSFTPELVYSFLYICSVLLFLNHLETGKRGWWLGSIVCFGLSLCSKEAAVTLPASLLILGLLAGHDRKLTIRKLLPHTALLAAYLLFAIVHLGVAAEALASLRTRPTQLESGGYYFMLGPHVLTNAQTAWMWALNLPVGMLGEWRLTTPSMSLAFWGFATVQMLLIPYALARGERRSVLAGLALFWITVLPAVPLMGHFLPYYVFLPVAGFAVMVGATWNRLYEDVSVRLPAASAFALAGTFAALILVCARASRSEAKNNFLLGASSGIAENTLGDLRALHPTLEPGTTVFVNNDSREDLVWHQAQGGLFKLAYQEDSLQFKYSSLKELPSDEAIRSGKAFSLVYKDGHLYEVK